MAKKGVPLHTRIFIGLILGAVAGGIAQAIYGNRDPGLQRFNETVATPIGNIFLYLIFMTVVPLLFSALVLGIGELGNAARAGKIGLLSLLMTVVLSGAAVGIGLAGVNLLRPGEIITEERRADLIANYSDEEAGKKAVESAEKRDSDRVFEIIPKNPFREMERALEGGLLPFMFFALVFGLALASVEAERAAAVRAFLDGIFAISQKIIEFAMLLAPIGVFFLVFKTGATLGVELLSALALYVVLVLGALAFHFFVTYSLALKLVARRSPVAFMRQMRTVILTAFATSSSNATLPTALQAATDDVGLPRDISSFVLTVGATANQNGTALFEGITIVFLAQLFGVGLSLADQAWIMVLAIIAGIGTAGVPSGSLPMIASVLFTFKVPVAGIGIITGIDRILDMSRTVLNVYGDMTIAACVTTLSGRQHEAAVEAAAE
ncbi:MAG TPA: dicarboxylate/amino acid:cation symporter [Fimbriimonas sp.]